MTDAVELVIESLDSVRIPAVIALARRIWQAHYPGIITQAQIDYMLDQRYTPARLQAELAMPDVRWELARRAAGELVGFSSTIHLPAERELKLDKLYVLPELHGLGVGRALVDSALRRAATLDCQAMVLAVNKHNDQAIAAYRRLGFVVRVASTTDIGGGFVMDDFIMARSLSATTAGQ